MKSFNNILSLAAGVSALALPAEVDKRADQRFDSNVRSTPPRIIPLNNPLTSPVQFDDLATTIAVPQIFPVGLYNGLGWGGVVVLVSTHPPSQHRHTTNNLTNNSHPAPNRRPRLRSSPLQTPTSRRRRPPRPPLPRRAHAQHLRASNRQHQLRRQVVRPREFLVWLRHRHRHHRRPRAARHSQRRGVHGRRQAVACDDVLVRAGQHAECELGVR